MRDAFAIERSIDRNVATLAQQVAAILQGMDNQSQLLNRKFEALVEGVNNQSELLNSKLEALIVGMNNQSHLLNRKFEAVVEGVSIQSNLLKQNLEAIIAARDNQLGAAQRPDVPPPPRVSAPNPDALPARGSVKASAVDAFAGSLMIAEKTYNTAHAGYDANIVRNFPGKILNSQKSSSNAVYADLKKLATEDKVEDLAWAPVLQNVLAEAKEIPHAELSFASAGSCRTVSCRPGAPSQRALHRRLGQP